MLEYFVMLQSKEFLIPLPTRLPDRPTLTLGSKSEQRVNLDLGWPQYLRIQAEISQICLEAQSQTGILDPNKLDAIDFQERLKSGYVLAEATVSRYQNNIFHWGVNALAHICLPLDYHSLLTRHGVVTISQLRHLIREDKLRKLKGVGPKTAERITNLFKQWAEIPIVTWNPSVLE